MGVDPISAIEQCLEVVDSEEDIIMDVAICATYDIPPESELGNSIFDFKRSQTIHKFYVATDSLVQSMRAYPRVDYRHFFMEFDALHGPDELDFRNSTTWPKQE